MTPAVVVLIISYNRSMLQTTAFTESAAAAPTRLSFAVPQATRMDDGAGDHTGTIHHSKDDIDEVIHSQRPVVSNHDER